MNRELGKAPAVRAALVALVLAILATGWVLVRAFRTDPLTSPAGVTAANLVAVERAPVRPLVDVQGAVENDLFAVDRTAPSAPYRMPDEGNAGAGDEPRPEPMKPTVLGTAVATDGRSFATLQLGDASPTLVHVGDHIGEWVVKGIARGKVILLSTSGARAELAVTKPGF